MLLLFILFIFGFGSECFSTDVFAERDGGRVVRRSEREAAWVRGCEQRLVPAVTFLLGISAGALVGCGFSLSNPREGRKLPSVRDANGGIINLLPLV